jgi:6-pyruvoyltetrahydropterin/6-carboxytetrahydropterin synthase
MRLTRVYRFSASHRLHSDQLSEERNWEVYGRCNNPYGHGHNYRLEVSVEGPVDRETGRVLDPRQLDQLVHAAVLDHFAHRNLNEEVADLQGRVPTTEVVADVVHQRLAKAWPSLSAENAPRLARVRIYETRNNVFEVVSQ